MRRTKNFAAVRGSVAVFAVVLIGDFSPLFGATLPLLHAINPGMEALNDNDTWTHISLAAARVLTQIKDPEEKITREHHEAREEKNDSERERERNTCDPVVIGNRKLAR